MIPLALTNRLSITYTRADMDCAYLRGQVGSLQHQVDFLQYGVLVFFAFAVICLAVALASRRKQQKV